MVPKKMHRCERSVATRAPRGMKTIAHTLVLLGLIVSTAACSNDASPKSERAAGTTGGESVLETAESSVNAAQQDFQRGIKPAADWVDEKAKAVATEGRKAATKVGDAVTGS